MNIELALIQEPLRGMPGRRHWCIAAAVSIPGACAELLVDLQAPPSGTWSECLAFRLLQPHEAMQLLTDDPAEFSRWCVAAWIERDRAKIEAGGIWMMLAMGAAGLHGIALPQWLSTAFAEKLQRVTNLDVNGLDVAFDIRPRLTHKRLLLAKRREALIDIVSEALAVRGLRGMPTSRLAFEEIGDLLTELAEARFGKLPKDLFEDGAARSHTHVERLYRDGIKRFGYADWAQLKKTRKRLAGKVRPTTFA